METMMRKEKESDDNIKRMQKKLDAALEAARIADEEVWYGIRDA